MDAAARCSMHEYIHTYTHTHTHTRVAARWDAVSILSPGFLSGAMFADRRSSAACARPCVCVCQRHAGSTRLPVLLMRQPGLTQRRIVLLNDVSVDSNIGAFATCPSSEQRTNTSKPAICWIHGAVSTDKKNNKRVLK